ncbi:MAG: hypothetical protein R3F62_00635 [Planctomycetota bacterium]
MRVDGLDFLATQLAQPRFECKLVFNREAALFFSGKLQHRDPKRSGLSYEDDSRGNALAARVTPRRIEVRYHERFTDAEVREVLRGLVAHMLLAEHGPWTLTYQGRGL